MSGDLNKMVDREEAENNVAIMAERQAMLYYHMVNNLVEVLGEEKTEEIVRKIIRDFGLDCGQKVKEKVISMGKEPVLENYYLGKDLPSFGWRKKKMKLEDKDSVASEVEYCPFANTWKKLDFEKWGRMYCFIDQAKYEGYNDCLKCYHDKNLQDGDDCCIVRVTKDNCN